MAARLGPYRPLHWVLRVSNRNANMKFLCEMLGMRVLRHEEFAAGCEAKCNGPYDGRWSKTMVGYAAESESFALEITYNYTHVEKYAKGNDLAHICVRAPTSVVEHVCDSKLPTISAPDGAVDVISPEGYVFRVEPAEGEPHIAAVRIHSQNAKTTAEFYSNLLGMYAQVEAPQGADIALKYTSTTPFALEIVQVGVSIDFAEAGGRLAIAVPDPKPFEAAVTATGGSIHTAFVELHTPGKASVCVVILCDPDGSEVCVVNDDGFSDLSRMDHSAQTALEKAIADDRSRA